jgi:hypothetical protein
VSEGPTAELVADRGDAAASDHFFRSLPFLDAEGVTHTLRIESSGSELLAPLIVREIPGTEVRDAISPYGYPGLIESDGSPTLDPRAVDFSATGLVSVFLRHRLGPPPLAGTTERATVQIADPRLPPKSRPSDRRQIRKNLEAGYELALVPGAETTPTQRAGFLDVYEQTMRRAAAAGHYFFTAAYFDRLLEADRTWLALAVAPGGGVSSAPPAALRRCSPPPRSPPSATATSTITSAAVPTPTCATRR